MIKAKSILEACVMKIKWLVVRKYIDNLDILW